MDEETKATMAQMDAATEVAMAELANEIKSSEQGFADGVLYVAQWVKRHYIKAGYKRLARGLISLVK